MLLLDQRGTGRSTPVGAAARDVTRGAGRVPDALPRRLDRARRGGDPPGARRRALERPRPELRRLLRRSRTCRSRRKGCARRSSPAACRRSAAPATTSTARPTSASARRTRRYYERYPEDRDRVREIAERLEAEDVRLPTGDRLTARRFRQLGNMLGMSAGAEQLHYILELPFGSPAFLHDVDAPMPFARNPIYAVIHEACYADGRRDALVGRARLPRRPAGRPDAPHRRARLPVDVRGLRGAAAARRGRRDPRRARVARPLRPEAAGRERGSGRGRDLRRGHVRRARASPRRPPRASAACAPGSPTSTSTTACARTGRASSAASSTWSRDGRRWPFSNCGTSRGASVASSRSTTCRSRSRKARSRG